MLLKSTAERRYYRSSSCSYNCRKSQSHDRRNASVFHGHQPVSMQPAGRCCCQRLQLAIYGGARLMPT